MHADAAMQCKVCCECPCEVAASEAWLSEDRSGGGTIRSCILDTGVGQRQEAAWELELQTNLREDFTITEKAPTRVLGPSALSRLKHY